MRIIETRIVICSTFARTIDNACFCDIQSIYDTIVSFILSFAICPIKLKCEYDEQKGKTMGTIFSRVKLSGKHVAALLALMLLSAVTAMLLPTALASMIDIGVAGENRNTILIIAAVMATLAILRLCVYYI